MRNAARASNKHIAPARADRQTGPQVGSRGGSDAGSSARHRKPPRRPFLLADDTPAPPTPRSSGQRRVRPDFASQDQQDQDDTPPRFTLPSVPLTRTRARSAPDGTRGHRALLSGRRAEQVLRRAPEVADDPWDEEDWNSRGWEPEADWEPEAGAGLMDRYDAESRPRNSSGRLRANSAARPLPAVPRRERKVIARAVATVEAKPPRTALMLSTASAPDLIAYRPSRARPRVDTRAIMETARKPWSVTRISLALLAAVLAIGTTYAHAGESAQPLMFSQAAAGAGPDTDAPWPVNAVTARVQPETQLLRPDLYDSVDQMNLWGPADCSAAVLSEVLTAYGVPNATIGRMVDELGPDISPHGGLETYDGFNKVAQLHGYRADLYLDKTLTYKQMQYLTNTLGIPVIVNVHIAYGYYRFFAGGHFLVMTYGDDQGLRLVDSSEYYVKYLPMDVFNSMFTQRTTVIVPKDYQYTLPT